MARLEHSVQGSAGAAILRLQKKMDDAAKAAALIPNAPITDENHRAASTLNIVFLAKDSESLEAWRQLTEKYEPKMRTRFAGQLMSFLSFSFQGDTTERITAWERETATYERDSGKILDDEIKVGVVLLRLFESQWKTQLLMRVDKLEKWTDFRDEVVPISRAIAGAQSPPTPMDIGAVGKEKSGKGGEGLKGAQTQQACSRSGNTDHTSANCLHSDKTCRKCRKIGHLASVSIFWNSSAQGRGWSEGQGRWQRCECCQDLLELW